MDWTDLHIFLTAVRAGNYTEAAKRLRITRTTVGRHVERLERQVGRLFEKVDNGVRPTATGAVLLEAARAMEAAVEAAQAKIGLSETDLSGLIRLASTAEIEVEFLDLFAEFRRMHPKLTLELRGDRDAVSSLSERKCDLAICICRSKPGFLDGRLVGPVALATYVGAATAAPPPADLVPAQQSWVSPGARIADLADRWSEGPERGADPGEIQANSWTALKEAIKAGLGAGRLWTFLADKDAGLRRVTRPDQGSRAQLWILHRKDVPLDARTESLLDFLATRLSERL